MNSPFFSIIIPTYNQAEFLKISLNSIFKQNFKNYEIIVIDNNSKDNTSKIISKYKKKIVYKKIDNKGIIAKSRNLGIKLSKGKWLAFLDSDDSWEIDKLKIIHQYINKYEFKVICHSEWISNSLQQKKKLLTYGPYQKNFYQIMLRQGNRLSTSATTVEKKFLVKNKILFNEKKNLISVEDYDFFLNIAKKNANFYFTNKPLGNHFFHSKSSSSNLLKHFKSIEAVTRHHVFNVQKFEKNKKFLWAEIKFFLNLKRSIFNFEKVNMLNYSMKLIFTTISRPIFTISYIGNLLIKKIKDMFFFIFYKLKFSIFNS